MREKRECMVVQDLLPNYLERLTNEETNAYIEEHLNNCQECKKVLENMKKEIKMQGPKIDGREVKFLKKYSRKVRILSAIILAIVIIYAIFIMRNMIIITTLMNKQNKIFNYDNYRLTTYNYEGGRVSIAKSEYKDGRYLGEFNHISMKESNKMLLYVDENKSNMYLEGKNGKFAFLNSGSSPTIYPHLYVSNVGELIMLSALSVVTSAECNGTDCYFINAWRI